LVGHPSHRKPLRTIIPSTSNEAFTSSFSPAQERIINMDDRVNSFPIILHPFLEKGFFPMNTIILFFQPYVNFTFIYE